MRRRSRSRPVRRFRRFPAALSLRPVRRFVAAVSGGGKDFLCDLRCGALARARFAASVRRSRSRPARRFVAAALSLRSVRRPLFPATLSFALGSPLRCGGFRRRQRLFVRSSGGALAHARFAALCFGVALARARFAALRRRFPAAAKTFCAIFGRRSRSARFAASVRRSRSRPARRPLFSAALAPVLKAVLKKTPALFFEHGRLLPHNFARFRQKARYSLLSFW